MVRHPGDALNLSGVRLLAVLPILTAALAAGCALWPAARRVVWPVVALAAINVVLTPLTSGEWFYQRQEGASYDRAVAGGDFTAFDRQLLQHDPHLQPRMTVIAVALLVCLVVLAVLRARARLGTDVYGLVLANPIPADAELDRQLHDRVLAEGLAAARAAGIHGKDVTPFLLDYFHRETHGASVAANVALVLANARVAAEIAVAYSGC